VQWHGIFSDAHTAFGKLAESFKHGAVYLNEEENSRAKAEKKKSKVDAKAAEKAAKKANKGAKEKREPSAYNIFMKAELARVKVRATPQTTPIDRSVCL